MRQTHLYAAMTNPVPRDLEPFAVINATSDTARIHGTDAIWREVVGKIRGRGLIWNDFMNFWAPQHHEPIKIEGRTFFGTKFIKVDFDFYSNFTWLNVDGHTLRMILVEKHRGTLESWQKKKDERTKRVQDFLNHVHSGRFTRNDYRELMDFERLKGAHMNETFSVEEMRDLLKGIEKFPIWKLKAQNTVA